HDLPANNELRTKIDEAAILQLAGDHPCMFCLAFSAARRIHYGEVTPVRRSVLHCAPPIQWWPDSRPRHCHYWCNRRPAANWAGRFGGEGVANRGGKNRSHAFPK